MWGQVPSLDWLRTVVRIAGLALALLVAFVPRRRTAVQVAALAGGGPDRVQLGVTHWFYLYVAWFAPLALVAFLAPLRGGRGEAETRTARLRGRAGLEELGDAGGQAVGARLDQHRVQPRVVVRDLVAHVGHRHEARE